MALLTQAQMVARGYSPAVIKQSYPGYAAGGTPTVPTTPPVVPPPVTPPVTPPVVPPVTPLQPFTTPTTPNPTASQQAWQQYLNADPFYVQTIGQASAQSQSDAAERARLVQQSLINFGEIPTGYSSPDVTDLTRSLAQDATTSGMSVVARLQKAAADARRDSMNQLGARGMLRSGETGHQLGELGLRANQSQYDARQSQMDFLYGRQYDFNQSELGRNLARIQAEFESAQRGAASGIGPLMPGYGTDGAGGGGGGFVLNPIGSGGGYNSAYIPPTPQGTPQEQNQGMTPPGYQYALVNGVIKLVPISGAGSGSGPGGGGGSSMEPFPFP